MTTMRIFVDTEFTDFIDCDRISIALVCGYDDTRELLGALDQRSLSQTDDHPLRPKQMNEGIGKSIGFASALAGLANLRGGWPHSGSRLRVGDTAGIRRPSLVRHRSRLCRTHRPMQK